jgi:drug/metabolite transporter (DMT)-like permease
LNSWALVFSAAALFALSFFIENKPNVREVVGTNIIFSVLLSITSTFVFILWPYLIRHLNVTKLSSSLLLIPIFSLAFNGNNIT